MKQTILGVPPLTYHRRLKKKILLCACLLIAAVAMNVLFVSLRTEENHLLMMWLNIAVDILCGFFLIYYTDTRIFPAHRLWRLMCRSKLTVTGTVDSIGKTGIRYMDIACIPVTVSGRQLFLPEDTLQLQVGEHCTLSTVSNIIVEAE